ncbi:ferritin-like domain-containing protein [Pterulicium gracile]|uniref:Ferritin-like domain-containing protein n=1 Tax=Pterulicium gracile TaxID=1884261 RepID=A0A5C3QRL3_9AGAR|nr:ferritin-like domain-containing protein [Pterula gracilis]
MKFAFPVALLLAAHSALANALPKRQTPEIDDTVILNYALTLEHLENAFYKEALGKFNAQEFQKAGYPPWVRRRFEEIAKHEATHVETLSSVLKDAAVQPCQYSFPYTDPKSFVALSQIIEGVGASAYTGAAASITVKDYLAAAASILATEARHAAWIAAAVNKQSPYTDAFETPLNFNQVFSLAASFITSCPESNPALPFTAFPALSFTGKTVAPNSKVRISYKAEESPESAPEEMHVAFLHGLNTEYAKVMNGEVTIPAGLKGTVYALLLSTPAVLDEATIAGPAVLEFKF